MTGGRFPRDLVAVSIAGCIVAAVDLPIALGTAFAVGPGLDGAGIALFAVILYGISIGLFLIAGFVVGTLRPSFDTWFALFYGAMAGGAAWAAWMLSTEHQPGIAPGLAILAGAIGGGWAAGMFGGLGFLAGMLVATRRRR